MTTVRQEIVPSERDGCLHRTTSLASTVWVNPSQRHLFSAIDFYCGAPVQEWPSRIRPGPCGISRYVRVLRLWTLLVVSDIIETALPRITSFRNLQEPVIGYVKRIDINHVSLDVLAPIFPSFAGTLKRLKWVQVDLAHESWKNIFILTNLLPNLMDIDLSDFNSDLQTPLSENSCILLLSDKEPPEPLAFKHFKLRELMIEDSIPLSSSS